LLLRLNRFITEITIIIQAGTRGAMAWDELSETGSFLP